MSVLEESTGTAVRASAVGRDLSFVQLQRRHGPFEPAPALDATNGAKVAKHFEPQPLVAASQALFDRWRSERLENDRQRSGAYAATKAWKRNAEAALQQKREKMLDQTGHDRPGITAWAKRRIASLAVAAMRKGIQLAATVQRARIRRQYPGPMWTECLRRQAIRGDDEALAALRSRYQRYTVDGSIDAIGPRPLGWAVIGVTARGTVRFSDGAGIVSHDGQHLHISGHDDVDALRSCAGSRSSKEA